MNRLCEMVRPTSDKSVLVMTQGPTRHRVLLLQKKGSQQTPCSSLFFLEPLEEDGDGGWQEVLFPVLALDLVCRTHVCSESCVSPGISSCLCAS